MDPQEAATRDANFNKTIAKDWEQTGTIDSEQASTTDFGQPSTLDLTSIVDNIAGKLQVLNLVTTDEMANIKTIISNSLQKQTQYLNPKVVAEILALISKMEIKVVKIQKNLQYGMVQFVYKLMFELHDTIGLYWRDSSTEKCNGIHVIKSLIKELIYFISTKPAYFTYKITKSDSIEQTENIDGALMSLGEGLTKSDTACSNKVRLFNAPGHTPVSAGGSKSRRRHRRHARKTRRGRGRTRKSKAKSKTHRRRHHSRVRKHKKNTYTRLR
jgi:hypothetical protein